LRQRGGASCLADVEGGEHAVAAVVPDDDAPLLIDDRGLATMP
jgi:hypothetical protein